MGRNGLSAPAFSTLSAKRFGTCVEILAQVVLLILRREGVGESRPHPHVTRGLFFALAGMGVAVALRTGVLEDPAEVDLPFFASRGLGARWFYPVGVTAIASLEVSAGGEVVDE